MHTPTPETDAEVRHWNCARIDFARRLERERDALARWKAEALSVAPPLQEIGVALGLPLGASIHDKILPALQALLKGTTTP